MIHTLKVRLAIWRENAAVQKKQRYRKRKVRRAARQKRRAVQIAAHRRALRRARTVSYHLLSTLAVSGLIVLGFCRNPEACLRFWEGLRDFFHTLACLCGFPVSPTVTQLSTGIVEGFPEAVEELAAIMQRFGALILSQENFIAYLTLIGKILTNTAYVLAYGVLPLLLVVTIAGMLATMSQNIRHGRKSKPLEAFLSVRAKVFLPICKYLKGLWKFFRSRKKYFLTFVLVLLFFLNVYTVILEFFAYYFFFIISEGNPMTELGIQGLKLLYDLFLAFRFLPIAVWALVFLWVFDRFRKQLGYAALERYEQQLRSFLDDRGVNILICGPPRTGKTTLLVSVAKSLMAKARVSAHDGMRDLERKFPDFPWIVLEMMLRKGYKARRFRTLSHVRKWVDGMTQASKDKNGQAVFLRHLNRAYGSCSEVPFRYPFFNYDTDRFKTVYNGGLGIETIEDAVKNYAQLYLIYIQPMLIISNFSIRSNDDFKDAGNFPEWQDDFFRPDPDPVLESQLAHIFNQDMVRPGKQVDPDCPYVNSFEYGFLIETEVGKERGNQYDRAGKKADDVRANVLNDLRDSEFKLMGHKGTIYNIPFAGYVGDEQRPESWGANARELCDIVTIRERCADKIVLPFFALEHALYLLVKALFGKYYDTVRFCRGDTTLLTYLLAHLCKAVYDHYDYIKNKFGGHFLKLNVEAGMRQAEDETKPHGKAKIFISNAKVYSNVFKTDAWKGVMERRAEKSSMGLGDVPTYKDVEASLDEFLEQRSYFFEELLKVYGKDEEKRQEALALIVGALDAFYAQAKAYGEDLAKALLGEFAAALPQIAKEGKTEILLQKLTRKRLELLEKGKAEAEKAKQTVGKTEKSGKDGTTGKNEAKKAGAAQNS